MSGIEETSRLRHEIGDLVKRLVRIEKATARFSPGESPVPYAGRVYDENEVVAGVSSMLDFWLTLGKEGDELEKEFAEYLGVRDCILANSGSSAVLLCVAALTSHELKERRLRSGDEVITAAAGFPTTLSPLFLFGLVPVLVDVDPVTANPSFAHVEAAFREGKTKAVLLAHTLGNPFPAAEIKDFCKKKNLWLIEDNCDALGSRYDGRLTGTFGDLSAQSFYPPHHITMGEGGMVNIVSDAALKRIVLSFRDWGRHCWCPSGVDETCKKRFSWKLGELPEGYDHKYIYSHFGFNLKPLDIQAAIGREQLKKLGGFVEARIHNWNFLRKELADLGDVLDFMLPTHAKEWTNSGFAWHRGKPEAAPSWFGFLMLVKKNSPVSAQELGKRLSAARIGNRPLFGGNLVRQPLFLTLREQARAEGKPIPFRVAADLSGADRLMREAVIVGVYPGLDGEKLAFIASTIRGILRPKK